MIVVDVEVVKVVVGINQHVYLGVHVKLVHLITFIK